MAAEISDNPDAQEFEIHVDGELAGLAAYRRKPGIVAFIHTETKPGFEGQGLASQLVHAALESVQREGIDVLPFCPFVNSYIADHAEFVPLVPESMREQFGLPVEVNS